MIIAAAGDAHTTKNKPVNRKDNYWEACKRKLSFIIQTAREENAEALVFPGDMTDTPALSYLEFIELLDIYNSARDIKKITVFGQHDMRYRTKPNTALAALGKALEEHFCIINFSETLLLESVNGSVMFYGSAYGEEIREPEPHHFNVLVAHRMIIEEKLWSQQEHYEASNIFLRKHNYGLIITGDNHQGFINRTPGKRFLVNCGAMMRNKIDQINHKPFMVIFNTITKECKQIFIPIEPAEDVFLMDKVISEQERNDSLESYVEGLNSQKEVGLIYEDNMKLYCEENQIEKEVTEEIRESFGG